MKYIIFDLEWNNAYNYKFKRGMNEIIEIGAVMLNDSLDICSTFKQLIKPAVSKKLGSRFKNLTHITTDEICRSGVPFEEAFDDFSDWCGDGDKLFLSWSTSDLYTLIANFKYFENTTYIDFMTSYADAQKYCMSFIEGATDGNQISLARCAELFSINTEEISFHRALEDCVITAYCFKKVYDSEKIKKYISICDESFFERLIFKPYFIKQKKQDGFDVEKTEVLCPICSGNIVPISDFEFLNNTFKGVGECLKCHKKFWTFIRAKQKYDSISVSTRAVKMNSKRARKYK